MQNKVLIVDFGSQYTQLIARRIRELFIYCEISPFNNLPEDLDEFKAVVLSGSPFSVNQKDSPNINLEPILGKKTHTSNMLWSSINCKEFKWKC